MTARRVGGRVPVVPLSEAGACPVLDAPTVSGSFVYGEACGASPQDLIVRSVVVHDRRRGNPSHHPADGPEPRRLL